MKLCIETAALDALALALKEAMPRISRIAIIADSTLEKLYGKIVLEKLEKSGLAVRLFSFPAGEASKIRQTKEHLEDALLSAGFDKSTAIVALGGGVALDLAGFIAATYMRGVALYSVPTSFLAMVDACYGGKNGVNTHQAKNAVGSVYFPRGIFIDPSFLKTLPEPERISGLAEVIKHAVIQDREFAYELMDSLKNKSPSDRFDFEDSQAMAALIEKNLKIKRRIVEASNQKDSFGKEGDQSKVRDQLNFGHTLGHALEALFDYEISHGYAVFIGMAFASFLSLKLNCLPEEEFTKIEALIWLAFPDLQALISRIQKRLENKSQLDLLIEYMHRDKKGSSAKIHFVLLKEMGKVYTQLGHREDGDKKVIHFTHTVDSDTVKSSLEEFLTRCLSYENPSVR